MQIMPSPLSNPLQSTILLVNISLTSTVKPAPAPWQARWQVWATVGFPFAAGEGGHGQIPKLPIAFRVKPKRSLRGSQSPSGCEPPGLFPAFFCIRSTPQHHLQGHGYSELPAGPQTCHALSRLGLCSKLPLLCVLLFLFSSRPSP